VTAVDPTTPGDGRSVTSLAKCSKPSHFEL
jgi:hypothetical protein